MHMFLFVTFFCSYMGYIGSTFLVLIWYILVYYVVIESCCQEKFSNPIHHNSIPTHSITTTCFCHERVLYFEVSYRLYVHVVPEKTKIYLAQEQNTVTYSEILATCPDESWTHYFQLGLAKFYQNFQKMSAGLLKINCYKYPWY